VAAALKGYFSLWRALGDGERKTLLTRQIAFEPLPASVFFGFDCLRDSCVHGLVSYGALADE
jgi:hypothetical protein